MNRDRLIQLIAAIVMIAATTASGFMLPVLVRQSDRHELKYTDVSVEGAPPIVAIGNAIGALRGIIVDYLWIKITIQKEKGLFYEVMSDADMLTKLQPRFAPVWAFHGHNMAYNISVATNTEQERWEWVNAGIRLVRDEGLRYNPNDLDLHKELSFWLAHKIEGYSDDAHLYYKQKFSEEWHYLLGEPPVNLEERVAWMQLVADAPETLQQAEERSAGVMSLVSDLGAVVGDGRRTPGQILDSRFLKLVGQWRAIRSESYVAKELGYAQEFRRQNPDFYGALDDIFTDASRQAAWNTLLAYTRKKVLEDEYNMDPRVMARYMREYGPFDWRHGQSHAFYFSKLGEERGEVRVAKDDDIYKIVNNDRMQLQALQSLAREGRIYFDPFSNELPGRAPEARWIEPLWDMFEVKYIKHMDTRGAGGETFIPFLQNFMSNMIIMLYRSGEHDYAQDIMGRLDKLFGRGWWGENVEYDRRLEVFVREKTLEEYMSRPDLAPMEVAASLRYGIREGFGSNRPEIWRGALEFSRWVEILFTDNQNYDFVNRYGRGRLSELLPPIDRAIEIAYFSVMADPTIGVVEKRAIWEHTDRSMPELRARTYGRLIEAQQDFEPPLAQQFARSPLSQRYSVATFFPPPPNLEEVRARLAREEQARQKAVEEARERDTAATAEDN